MSITDPQENRDPWQILGLSQDAEKEQIRAAYLSQVKAFPPERAPQQFQDIRWAYEQLTDPTRRAKQLIQSELPNAPLTDVLDRLPSQHRFVGPEPWLKALRDQSKDVIHV